MESWPASAQSALTATPPPAAAPAGPAHYVPLPRRLAADLRDTPAAVGAFALVARAFRTSGQPVPISAGDLQRFDPALSEGAATRALQRLAAAGWLIPTRQPGRKTVYTPSWGRVHDTPLPWNLAAPSLGRPRHIAALRLDQRLLDVCMGRIETHPSHPAMVRRYLAAPLLGLREVGAYALALAGLPVASPNLERLRLLADGQPLPLPDEATILAIASQRDGHALSPAGWRRTPFAAAAPAPAADDSGQALFFVPPDMIGPVIGGVIAGPITISTTPEAAPAASERHESPSGVTPAGSHGVMDSDRVNPPPPSPSSLAAAAGGGGALSLNSDPANPAPAPSETARLLRSAGVRHSVAAALADRPASQVARVIAQARARSDVRDLAGWVVSALRDLPADLPAAAPPPRVSDSPILFHPGISGRERQIWLGRFRAADPADRQAILDRFFTEFGHGDAS